jgi:hypothetical protein
MMLTKTWIRALMILAALGILFFQAARLSADDAPKNLALKMPSTASSQEKNHAPADGNDGDPKTRWCAVSAALPQWWQVDLQNPSNLGGAEIKWEKDGKKYQFILEGSVDNQIWQTLSDQSNSQSATQTESIQFTASGIRYVRIRFTALDTGCWASFFELKIFGK